MILMCSFITTWQQQKQQSKRVNQYLHFISMTHNLHSYLFSNWSCCIRTTHSDLTVNLSDPVQWWTMETTGPRPVITPANVKAIQARSFYLVHRRTLIPTGRWLRTQLMGDDGMIVCAANICMLTYSINLNQLNSTGSKLPANPDND